jgi:hypothetical protein
MIIRPGLASCSTSAGGIVFAAAPTWIASYGPCCACPAQPPILHDQFLSRRLWKDGRTESPVAGDEHDRLLVEGAAEPVRA